MSELANAAVLTAATLVAFGMGGRLEFLRREIHGHRRRATALLFFAGTLCTVVFLPLTGAGGPPAVVPDEFSFPMLFAAHAVLLFFLIGWQKLTRHPIVPRGFRWRGFRLSDVTRGLRLGVAAWAITLSTLLVVGGALQSMGWIDSAGKIEISAQPEDSNGSDPSSANSEGKRPEPPAIFQWIAELPITQKLALIASTMTVEELFFRGFLQPRIGLIPSSLLFAAGHASYGLPTLLVGVFVVSLVLGVAYDRTNRLLPVIVAHGVFDAIQLLVVVPLVLRQLQALN